MSVEGWAFNKDYSQEEFYSRYKELQSLGVDIYIESVNTGYGHKVYQGKVIDGLEEVKGIKDIGLICDDGNLCFGGRGSLRSTGEFTFTVHTD